jgi:hypothetical protein
MEDWNFSRIMYPSALPGGNLKVDRLKGALAAIDGSRLSEYLECIPSEWSGPTMTGEKIKGYLIECIANFERIRLQLESIL